MQIKPGNATPLIGAHKSANSANPIHPTAVLKNKFEIRMYPAAGRRVTRDCMGSGVGPEFFVVRTDFSVKEMPHAGKNQGDSKPVCSSNNLIVPD